MVHSIDKKILDTIIKTSNNNVTITDEKGYILKTNPDHWSVYGVEPGYYIGKTIYELEEEGILNPSITAQVIKKKKPVQLLQKTNTGKIIMSTAYPIFDDNGKLVRVISYAQDQTEILSLKEQYEQLKMKIEGYQHEVEELRQKDGIIYRSKEMEQIIKTIHRVANSNASILLLGESGVGKSMFAQLIHRYSSRSKEPFIEINCSTIPDNLFESEMFGYESGSFTGAKKHGKPGLIQQAHNGTLFLDEIGELPLSIQVKLLKVIQEKKFIPVGGKKEIHVDFRLITATNRDLDGMVQDGKFRLDLYYRLNVVPLHIPSLRERKEDITVLINFFLRKMNEKYQTEKKLHYSTYDLLLEYNWPGNVRELENLIERLVLISEDDTIHPTLLPNYILGEKQSRQQNNFQYKEIERDENLKLNQVIEEVERKIILKAFEKCKSTYEMAKLLGISQPSVVRKLKKYKVE